MDKKVFKIGGLRLHVYKTDKFKTTDVVLNFRNKLNPEEVTARAILPYVLKAGTNNYPSKQAINKELEKLYGASLGVSVNKNGAAHLLSFRMSLVNDKYLRYEESLLDKAFQLFSDVIFNPSTNDGAFEEKIINEEKRLLKDHFNSLKDNKIKYSLSRLIEVMCANEDFKSKSIGRLEDVDDITPHNLYELYQRILKTDTIDLFIIGDVDENRVKNVVTNYFKFDERPIHEDVIDRVKPETITPRIEIEKHNVKQGKLNIGFRTNTWGTDDDYYSLLVMNGVLGAYPHSLLFRNVREKESLCYYIASRIDKAKGLLLIFSGVEIDQFEKALTIIREQLEMVQNGKFDDSMIDDTKRTIVNGILELHDSPISILGNEYNYMMYGDHFDLDNIINKINSVTKEDIVSVANKIQEDTVFFLTGNEVK
ncbi:EF-P 5-aminopentanol modification-associated protein YfmF [Haloplasma contractile]|uniref:Inactive metalloprotease YmfF protein n=1 Tax=Haloplasma contractile SSD-17B TaxID=1033810 RepID=U2FLF0_9MOLU|nr:pitrilysin family protein [Haloplasma contractile]ERJ13570.1 putative inactive metalloprotease YmfF protein [Haloplasma contractile SSD-17B]